MKNLVILSRDWKFLQAQFEQSNYLQSHFKLLSATISPATEVLKKAEVVLGDPDLGSTHIQACTHLQWFQSTWAGNNKLQSIAKQNYILTGIKDVFGQPMLEYVLSYLLYFTRRINDFSQLKEDKTWRQLSCPPLSNYQIGIMGLGNIGTEVAQKLLSFGMRVNGLATQIKHLSGINEYTIKDLPKFLEGCDFVLNLLPETQKTIGLCNVEFFSQMKASSVFINAGRGSVIDSPNSIIQALNHGYLSAAVLDVFDQEPLAPEHPYYNQANVYISCHTAAISDPQQVFDLFETNAKRFIEGKSLLYRHNFDKAY